MFPLSHSKTPSCEALWVSWKLIWCRKSSFKILFLECFLRRIKQQSKMLKMSLTTAHSYVSFIPPFEHFVQDVQYLAAY